LNGSWRKVSEFFKHRRGLAILLVSLILLLLVPLAYSTYTRVFSLDTGTYYFKLDNGAGIKFSEPKIYFDNFTWLGDNGIQFTNLKIHDEEVIPGQFYIYVDKPVNITFHNVYEKTSYGYYFKAEVKNPNHLITTLKIPYPNITADKILLYVDGKEALRLELYDFNHTDYECWHLSSSDIWFKVTGSTVEIKFMNETEQTGGGGVIVPPITATATTATTPTTKTYTTSERTSTRVLSPQGSLLDTLEYFVMDFLSFLQELFGPLLRPIRESGLVEIAGKACLLMLFSMPFIYLMSRGISGGGPRTRGKSRYKRSKRVVRRRPHRKPYK